MCDYSLQSVKTRDAKIGDKLIVTHWGTGTQGFAAINDFSCAVCLKPGTELALDESDVAPRNVFVGIFYRALKPNQKTAIFRQVNRDDPHRHHDALEFTDGEQRLLTTLNHGTRATVLQLPKKPRTAKEREEQTRVAIVA